MDSARQKPLTTVSTESEVRMKPTSIIRHITNVCTGTGEILIPRASKDHSSVRIGLSVLSAIVNKDRWQLHRSEEREFQ